MGAAVRTHQLQQEQDGADSDRDSEGSMESVSSDRSSERGARKASYNASKKEGSEKKAKINKKRKSKSSSMKNKLLQERISQYREGKQNLPSYEVIQNSFHVKTGKVDLQLCDDMSGADMADTVQGSMLIQVRYNKAWLIQVNKLFSSGFTNSLGSELYLRQNLNQN